MKNEAATKGNAVATQTYPSLEVRVRGPAACFTRPEMKVERVSYPVMTPSAARGVLESIFWKPEFTWRVREIHVLSEIRYFSILRNEVNHRQTEDRARNWARAGGVGGYDAADGDNRAQRHTLGLRDVDYIVRADAELKPGVNENPAKYRDQFRRRVERGQCFATPYLGCREFAADFLAPDGSEPTINVTEDLGLMLLDLEYEANGSGHARPVFFDARLQNGVLHVPRLEDAVAAQLAGRTE